MDFRPVTMRALLQRINRRLAKHGETIRKTRQGGWPRVNLGEYYVINLTRNSATETHVLLFDFARKLGVISESERLATA